MRNNWWQRQLIETIIECSKANDVFEITRKIEDFDKADELFTECTKAYNLENLRYLELIKIGKSLRGLQAQNSNKDKGLK